MEMDKEKAQVKEIFKAARILIENGEQRYMCYAIKIVLGYLKLDNKFNDIKFYKKYGFKQENFRRFITKKFPEYVRYLGTYYGNNNFGMSWTYQICQPHGTNSKPSIEERKMRVEFLKYLEEQL